jgi:hypothetical protein
MYFDNNHATINKPKISCNLEEIYNGATRNNPSCTATTPKISRDGYEILGFANSPSSTAVIYNQNSNVTINSLNNGKTYYALTKKTLTLSYQSNGGTGSVSPQSCVIYNGTTSCSIETRLNTFEKTNNDFIGWEDSDYQFKGLEDNTYYKRLITPGDTIKMSKNVTLKASWLKHLNDDNWYQLNENNPNLVSNMYNAYQPEIVYIGEYTSNSNLNTISKNGQYKYIMYFFGWSCSQTNNITQECPNGYANDDYLKGADSIFLARAKDLSGPWEVYSNDGTNDYWDTNMEPKYWKIILGTTNGSKYDTWHVGDPSVVYHNGVFYMAYSACGLMTKEVPHLSITGDYYEGENIDLNYKGPSAIGGAWSNDGINWIKLGQQGYIWTIGDAHHNWTDTHGSPTPLLIWEDEDDYWQKYYNSYLSHQTYTKPFHGGYQRPHLIFEDNKWKIWFDFQENKIGYAESKTSDFLTTEWEIHTTDPTISNEETSTVTTTNGNEDTSANNLAKANQYYIRTTPYLNLSNYYNSNVDITFVKVGDIYYGYGDPFIDWIHYDYNPLDHNRYYSVKNKDGSYNFNWVKRQIVEYISIDGRNWTPIGYMIPDENYDANQVPEVFYDEPNNRICLFYANQLGSYYSAPDYDIYRYEFGPIRAKCKNINNF